MHEGAPRPHIPYEADDFEETHHEHESPSPMEQKLDFNVDIVFDDLENIIPEYNKFIENKGNRVPEEMIWTQNEALNAVRSIKNIDGPRPSSKTEFIAELEKREKEGKLTTEARELIEGIL